LVKHYRGIKLLLHWTYVIHTYYIDNNQLKDDGAKAIGNALQRNSTLAILHLSNKYLL
jgi:hypothetical protein